MEEATGKWTTDGARTPLYMALVDRETSRGSWGSTQTEHRPSVTSDAARSSLRIGVDHHELSNGRGGGKRKNASMPMPHCGQNLGWAAVKARTNSRQATRLGSNLEDHVASSWRQSWSWRAR